MNEDGSVKFLDPTKDQVEFTADRDDLTTVSPYGIVELGERRTGEYDDRDRRMVTANYQSATGGDLRAHIFITVKEPAPDPPRVNQDCTHPAHPATRANKIIISTWLGENNFILTDHMRELEITWTGTRRNTDKPTDRNHIFTFPCYSQDDFARAWRATYLAPPTRTMKLLTASEATAGIQELIMRSQASYSFLDETEQINIGFNHADDSYRNPTQEQILRTNIQSLQPDIVRMTGPTEYKTIRPGTATLRATYQGHTAEIQVTVLNLSLDSQCRGWQLTWSLDHSKTIEYARLNTVHLKLHKGHGRSVAQEIADRFGATLEPGLLKLEPDPTYVLEMGRKCDPAGQTIQEKISGERVTRRDFTKDPRVSEVTRPRGSLNITVWNGDPPLPPDMDLGWHRDPLEIPNDQIAGVDFHVYRPDNINPLNQILVIPYLIDTDGNRQKISKRLAHQIKFTSDDQENIRIQGTPRKYEGPTWQFKRQTIRAHRPGQAELTMKLQGHTATKTVTVQPPLAAFPEIPRTCTHETDGVEFDSSRMVITLGNTTQDGYTVTPEYAHAIAGYMNASVIASTPDGRTHLLEGHCAPPRNGEFSFLNPRHYAEIESMHPHIRSIDQSTVETQ